MRRGGAGDRPAQPLSRERPTSGSVSGMIQPGTLAVRAGVTLGRLGA